MTVDFDILKRNELRAAVELVGRAFEDYEYFTNYFPDLEESKLLAGKADGRVISEIVKKLLA